MEKIQIIERTKAYVRQELYGEASGHDWWHTFRVWKTAQIIAQAEQANTFTVELAALLHDISDYKLNGGNSDLGPAIAREWLEKLGVDAQVVSLVGEIISEISFKGAGVSSNVSSIEGGIVQDADRLDAIGAIGIARAFAFGGYKGDILYDPDDEPQLHQSVEEYRSRQSSSINHFYEKLLLLKDLMNTDTAKQIAGHRHRFMTMFLNEFFLEWNAEDLTEISGRE